MSTNLPAEYFDAEKRYRTASTSAEKLACIEKMLTIIPKHKGTDKLRADLRKRISKLKSAAQAQKSLVRHESAYHINKEGGGQVSTSIASGQLNRMVVANRIRFS